MRGPAGLPLTAVALLALVAIGCDSTPRPSGSDAPGPADASPAPTGAAAAPGDCAARIAAIDLSNEATILAVDACRFTLEGRTAAQAALTAGATGAPLWAAVWVYAASGNDPAPLRPVLQSGDPSVRVMAAAALASFGESAGFEPLRADLADATALAGSEPPVTIGAFAVQALERLVVADALPTDAAGWDTWLRANAARLAFDQASGTWRVP